MTEEEYKYEHHVVYETWLGIFGVIGAPTPEQHAIAQAEADQTIAEIRKEL